MIYLAGIPDPFLCLNSFGWMYISIKKTVALNLSNSFLFSSFALINISYYCSSPPFFSLGSAKFESSCACNTNSKQLYL